MKQLSEQGNIYTELSQRGDFTLQSKNILNDWRLNGEFLSLGSLFM